MALARTSAIGIEKWEGEIPPAANIMPNIIPFKYLLALRFPRDGDRIIHVHIPRSGGTSFRNLLLERYGESKVAIMQEPMPGAESVKEIFIRDVDSYYWTNRKRFLRNWWRRKFPKSRIYHGHVPLFLYPGDIINGSVIVTWLRDPVSLVLSWYMWEKYSKIPDIEPDIYKFINQRPRQNIMTEMLQSAGPVPIYYGITEYYLQDLAVLLNALGWKWEGDYIPHLFGQPNGKERFSYLQDRSLIQEIRRLNQEDVDLYTSAIKMRNNYAL